MSKFLWGFTPHTPWCFSMVIDYKGLLYAPADKTLMAHPLGHRLCEPYQTPDAGRHAPGGSYAPSI